MNTLEYALAYASLLPGTVLPVMTMGKRPVMGGWQKEATTDPDTLRRWFQSGKANIGWQPDQNVMVLDVDMKAGEHGVNGFGTLARLESKHGALPVTLSATTPTGGKHYVFRLPDGIKAKNLVGSKAGYAGLDIRTKGGQIVVAPSERAEGVYSWDNWNPLEGTPPDIASAPEWLVKLACGELDRAAPTKANKSTSAKSRRVEKGGRNAALVSEACALRRRGWDEAAIIQALRVLNETQFSPAVEDSEVVAVAKWACGKYEPTNGADIAEARGSDAWEADISKAGGVADILNVARNLSADPALSRSERASLIKQAAKKAGVSVAVLQADLRQDDDDNDNTPIIKVVKANFAQSVDNCLQVLPAIATLRQRGGELVEVVSDGYGVSVQGVDLHRLGYLTSRHARWQSGDSFGSPDASVLQAVLSAGAWPNVPKIVGLLKQPVIDLQTGDIINGSGYAPSLQREAVFDTSAYTAYDGDDAFKLLQGLLSGFPFPTAHDEAAAMAAILTAAIRPILPTAPAFFVSACDFGSGKSYLSKLIAAFAGGAGVQRWPGRAEEQSKALLALLMEGRSAVIFDNMSSDWRSDTMAAILTDPVHSDRILGVSSNATVSTACLWIGNGVNVGPVADLQRRVITITLDAKVEKPWERTFDADPVAEVEANRGRWLMIALKVLSDFIKGGDAPELSSLGSFADWTRVVRGAVVANGLPDPVEALGANVADDEERELLARVLWFWSKAFPGEPMTSRDLIRAVANASGESNEAGLRYALEEIAEERGEISRRRLGYWLRAHKGRIVDRLRLVSAGSKGEFGAAWYVQQV